MESRQNRDRVLQELRSHLGRDRARTKAFAVSELGLVEMTRQRVRPSLWHSMTTECPACAGTGRVFTPEAVARRLERSLKRAGTGAPGAADRGPAAPGCSALSPGRRAQADSHPGQGHRAGAGAAGRPHDAAGRVPAHEPAGRAGCDGAVCGSVGDDRWWVVGSRLWECPPHHPLLPPTTRFISPVAPDHSPLARTPSAN